MHTRIVSRTDFRRPCIRIRHKQIEQSTFTHTAVAANVMEQYREATGDETLTVFVSTASPFKFCDNVLKSLGVAEVSEGLDALDQLNEVSGRPAPVPLASLRNKPVRFEQTVEKEKMLDVVLDFLK